MLSLVVNTYNNADVIGDCIRSAQPYVEDVVVCDMHSTDDTVAIAQALGARIVYHPKAPSAEPARKTVIGAATEDWVLVLDADERLTPRLGEKLRELIAAGRHDALNLWSRNWYYGGFMEHGGFYYQQMRCFRRDLFFATLDASEDRAHSGFGRVTEGATSRLDLPKEFYYDHLAYPSIEKYVARTLAYYPLIESQYDHEHGVRFSKWKMLVDPVKTFLNKYVREQGYRDGTRGLITCVMYAHYVFLKQAHLWYFETVPPAERQTNPKPANASALAS